MDLWIRSQNKGRLRLISNLRIYQEEGQTDFNIQDDGCMLGTYTTYERALEVLDEIQYRMLKNLYIIKTNGFGEELDLKPNHFLLYEMPE